jgi:hypothetical protein
MLTPMLVLTPHGLLTLRQTDEAPVLTPELGSRLEKTFAQGAGHGLLYLGADEVGIGRTYVCAASSVHLTFAATFAGGPANLLANGLPG